MCRRRAFTALTALLFVASTLGVTAYATPATAAGDDAVVITAAVVDGLIFAGGATTSFFSTTYYLDDYASPDGWQIGGYTMIALNGLSAMMWSATLLLDNVESGSKATAIGLAVAHGAVLTWNAVVLRLSEDLPQPDYVDDEVSVRLTPMLMPETGGGWTVGAGLVIGRF